MMHGRGSWDNHWDLVSRYVLPRKDRIYGQGPDGGRRNQYVFDTTPIHANEILASALNGMFVSNVDNWLELETGIPELDEDTENRLWFQDTARRVLKAYSESNFYTEMHEAFLDLGSLGTSTLYQDMKGGKLKFLCRPIYMFHIEQDLFKNVNAILCEYEYTFPQLLELYGEKSIPKDILDGGMVKDLSEKFKVYQLIERNGLYNTVSSGSKKFTSVHFLERGWHILKEHGYHEFPYAVPRWTLSQDEKYGRSPAMKVLPDIMMLNKVMESHLQIIQQMGNPVLQVPSDSFLLPLKTRPGSWNYYRSGTKDRIEPLLTGARPDVSADFMSDVRLRIQRGFFVDQLQTVEGPQKTATEVIQRREEQFRIIGPVTSRLYKDLILPTVERTLYLMQRANALMEPPARLREGNPNIKVKLVSQIAKAQKVSQADSFARVVQASGPVVEANPMVLNEVFDEYEVIKLHADIFNLPEKVMKTEAEFRDKRAQQEQAQRDAQGAETDKMESESIKNIAIAEKGGRGGKGS